MALLGNLTGSSHLNFQDIIGFYNGVATQSLRTTIADKSLKRTPGSESNKRTFTFSTWFKRSVLDHVHPNTVHQIFSAQVDGNDYFAIYLTDDFKLRVQDYHTSEGMTLIPNRLFRDVSAWYHLVVAIDTTQGTAANRVKIYVNGVQETSFATATYPSQNYDTYINDDVRHTLACAYTDDSQRFEGYWADTNLIDGLQLAPTSFGEFRNGVWIPINTSGLTFGTNGFRLQFKQVGVGTASSTTIGADTSGNNNHYTSTNIVASDCAMPDSPENNFATLNPLYYLTASTHLSEGNLQLTHEATAHRANAGTMFSKTGKWYFEVHNKTDTAASTVAIGVGLQDISKNLVYASGADNYIFYSNNNNARTALNTTVVTWSTDGTHAPDAGDIIQVAYDADSGKIFFGIDNTYYAADAGADGNPATGDNPSATLSTSIDYIPFVGTYNNEATVNFGQDDTFAGAISSAGNTDGNGIGVFKYAPPSGFLSLCTANLPEPTIGANSDTQADDHFNTVIYTGTGSSNAITGVGFQTDWLWIKRRNGATSHRVFDSTRADGLFLSTDTSNSEDDGSSLFTSFDSDGFTVEGTSNSTNASSQTYVAWNWKANGGTTSSNTDGNVTSTVQANTDAGFSIVTFPADNTAGRTVGHGLGVAPKMIITKGRAQTTGWYIYNYHIGAGNYLVLNTTAGSATSTGLWGNTHPTSSVFTIGNNDSGYNSGGANDALAYCFAEVEGYSKFGSYTGNANADGTFVYTGFRPAFVIVKSTSTANWEMFDTTRSPSNVIGIRLFPSLNNAENTGEANCIDIVSNGFKVRGAYTGVNQNATVHIYMAFGDSFKYANAR